MKYKKIIIALLALVMILSSIMLPAGAAFPQPDRVNAKSALLYELNTGTLLYEQDADATVYPASLTKIMTCLLVLENGKLSDTVTVSASALADIDDSSSTAGLQIGEKLTLEELLHCIMLSSANEACNVAAEYVSGDIASFVNLMNTRASELGCTGTHYINPHGLHDEDHYTTARDLFKITSEAMKNKVFAEIVSTPSYKMPATNLSEERTLVSTNKLIIKNQNNPYYDRRVTGVKTGFTTPAGRCLIATAEDNGLKLLSVVCGCDTVILESGDLEFASFPETEKLLDFGFSSFQIKSALNTLYPVAEIPVSRAVGTGFVSLVPKNEITALLPADCKDEEITVEYKLISDKGVSAPVAAGDELGTAIVSCRGEVIGEAPLIAITDVARATLWDIISKPTGSDTAWVRVVLIIILILAVLFVIIVLLLKARKKRLKQKRRKLRVYTGEEDGGFDRNDWYTKE